MSPAAGVLVAESDPVMRRVLHRLLERSGHRVALAEDAEQALAEMRREPPAVALLAADLPPRGALEVLREARRERALQACRFILLTARYRRADWQEAERSGADAMLPKPFSPAELLGRIREWTQTALPAPGDAAAAAGGAPEPEV